MTNVSAKGPVKRIQIEAVVIRGNTGIYGPPGEISELGVVADSARHWRFGPGRLLAWARTKRANRRANGKPES